MTDINVPQLGESVTEATVGSWLVKTGDVVAKDDVLVELETDKVAVEIRAEADGVMGAILAEEGETVEVGAKLAEMGGAGAAPAAAAAPSAAPAGGATEAIPPGCGRWVKSLDGNRAMLLVDISGKNKALEDLSLVGWAVVRFGGYGHEHGYAR